jgi:hypothetical protein
MARRTLYEYGDKNLILFRFPSEHKENEPCHILIQY